MKYPLLFQIVTLSCLLVIIRIDSAQGQQLKLGSNPTQIEKSAALQIDSKNQGVLLPRIDNLIDIETLLPKDGTVIYYTNTSDPTHTDAGLYVRKNGVWVRLVGSSELGIFSLNGDHTSIQTFSLTTISGASLGFSTNGSGSQKLNIPFASTTDNGLLSTNVQSINGIKTFTNSPKIKELTEGSVVFIGDGQALSEDNGHLYWDRANKRLGIGLGNGVTPGNTLEINSSVLGNGGIRFTQLNSSSPIDPNGVPIGVNSVGDLVRVPGVYRTTATVSGSFKSKTLSILDPSSFTIQLTQTIPISQANIGANVIVNPRSGLLPGMWISNPRVISNGEVTIDIFVASGLLGSLLGTTVDYELNLDIALIQ